ncbi:MAG: pyridoxamine 5'-phosphate oxidase family protein [Chloroflexi bacterium]|nr:pyridoxamine 5'-phosphate oxidase family protein [Chloroflexota bacterium]
MSSPRTEVIPRTGRGTEAHTDAGNTQPLEWQAAVAKFEEGGWFWLATVRPNGRPHAMPCFAAWSGSSFFVASKGSARKSRNLDANGSCVLTKDVGDIHIIVEGLASRVTDEATLRRAAEAMMRIYEWPTRPVGDELDDYGAPTSGGPPYRIYEIRPTRGFGLPTDGETFAPTRWRFPTAE